MFSSLIFILGLKVQPQSPINFDKYLIGREPSQANVKMMRKSIGIHFVQRDLGVWELVPRTIFKSLSLERKKMPLCVVRKFVYMVDRHSGMENIILPSNLCSMNLKNSKV